MVYYTHYIASFGNARKRYDLIDGKVVSPEGHSLNISTGNFVRVPLPALENLPLHLLTLRGKNIAIIHGRMINDAERASVVTERQYEKLAKHPDDVIGVMARTHDHLEWSPGVNLTMFDIDDGGLSAAQAWDVVAKLIPEFNQIDRVYNASSSSYIYESATGKELRGGGKWHLYWMWKGDLKAFVEDLKLRFWLNNQGYHILSKPNKQKGICNVLERFPVDFSVFDPARVDYVAGAICGEGLEQRLPDPELVRGEWRYLDLDKLPRLTDEERRQALQNKQRAESAFRGVQLDTVTKNVAAIEKVSVSKARAIAKERIAAANRGELAPDHLLYLMDGRTITASQIDDSFDGVTLRDPLEPDYRNGAQVAIIFCKDGKWNIFSQAHGGQKFYPTGSVLLGSQQLTSVNETINSRYLGELRPPSNARLIVIRSDMGTGKTYAIRRFLEPYEETAKWVFTYRTTLELSYAEMLGIPSRNEITAYGEVAKQLGVSICVNSARKECKVGFDGCTARPGIVILDEVRSVAHTLVSCPNVNRGSVLPEIATFFRRCVESGYPIILMDANVTDLEVALIQELAGVTAEDTWILNNEYQGWEGKQVYSGSSKKVFTLYKEALLGDRPILCTTNGKGATSKFGTQSLEAEALARGKTVLRIDADTARQKGHPAQQFLDTLSNHKDRVNDELKKYGVVIFSPVIESGYSIELFDHFVAQFSFCNGNLTPESQVQQMLRLRDRNVPIYFGETHTRRGDSALLKGNHSTNPETFYQGERLRSEGNLHQLTVMADSEINNAFLGYWIKDCVRLNACVPVYCDMVLEMLKSQGCTVTKLPSLSKEAEKALTKELNTKSLCRGVIKSEEIAAALSISDKEQEEIEFRELQTADEQLSLSKKRVERRFNKTNPAIALLDMLRPQFYYQAQLLFWSMLGGDELKERDQRAYNSLLIHGKGRAFVGDINRSSVGFKARLLQDCGLTMFLGIPGEEVTNASELVRDVHELIKAQALTLQIGLGIDLAKLDKGGSENWGAIRVINHLSKTFWGVPLFVKSGKTTRVDGKRHIIYRVNNLLDAPVSNDKLERLDIDWLSAIAPTLAASITGNADDAYDSWLSEGSDNGGKGKGDRRSERTAVSEALAFYFLPTLLQEWTEQEIVCTKKEAIAA